MGLCIFKNFFGLPCPGCGMTRAYFSLFKFDLASAFYYHPLFLLPVILAIIVVFKNNSFFVRLYKNNILWVSVSAGFILLWIVRLILFFPDTPPMEYNSKALIPQLFRLFGG
ncbi:DUF2752 domain-containing protein [Acetivibrio mesophilus]|uniref:DUF2752 domain-containing protein n=1 Tax=Acetivibrio mesophilus TaxID=2487273 RepID=A0A4Q0I5J2_9FIRM|nr:DUF2752 domain-containing protein [Acetivibrio mesophilus]RXE59568.1 DUF2752 domain-containing protein [Acetivibrio mesophilus]